MIKFRRTYVHKPVLTSSVTAELGEAGIMRKEEIEGISSLVRAGNRAAHGAVVEPEVAEWAMKNGPAIIAVLESKLKEIEAADPPIKVTRKPSQFESYSDPAKVQAMSNRLKAYRNSKKNGGSQ